MTSNPIAEQIPTFSRKTAWKFNQSERSVENSKHHTGLEKLEREGWKFFHTCHGTILTLRNKVQNILNPLSKYH